MAVAQELYILEFGCDALNSATMVIGQSCLHVIYSAKCSIVFAGFEFLKTEFLFFLGILTRSFELHQMYEPIYS